jgi:hypothetical protein
MLGRRDQVKAQPVLLGVADELPLVGEAAVVMPAELVEDHAPRFANKQRVFQEIDERLGGQRRRHVEKVKLQ